MSEVLSLLGNNMLERILRLDAMPKESGISYAFGGAVALGYYSEPRATTESTSPSTTSEREPVQDQLGHGATFGYTRRHQ
jgi:hypothetical protein